MVVTNDAITNLVNFMAGEDGDYPTYIATGSSDTDATKEDTSLSDEKGRDAIETVTKGTDNVSYSSIFPITQLVGFSLKEAGLFSASTGGDMFTRFTHSTITKTNTIEVQYEIKIKFTY